MSETPITAAWLLAHDWKLGSERNDPHTQLPGFRVRPIAYEVHGGRAPFQSHDDLCIALAPDLGDDRWSVWIYQMEPYRHIHVRQMRFTGELVRLWEGLTGQDWLAIHAEGVTS